MRAEDAEPADKSPADNSAAGGNTELNIET